jgi:hypothetical protein
MQIAEADWTVFERFTGNVANTTYTPITCAPLAFGIDGSGTVKHGVVW